MSKEFEFGTGALTAKSPHGPHIWWINLNDTRISVKAYEELLNLRLAGKVRVNNQGDKQAFQEFKIGLRIKSKLYLKHDESYWREDSDGQPLYWEQFYEGDLILFWIPIGKTINRSIDRQSIDSSDIKSGDIKEVRIKLHLDIESLESEETETIMQGELQGVLLEAPWPRNTKNIRATFICPAPLEVEEGRMPEETSFTIQNFEFWDD